MHERTARAATITGPSTVEVRDVTVPAPGPGQVQIQTLFSGISAGTEMNVYRGRAPMWCMHRQACRGRSKSGRQCQRIQV